MMWIAQKDYETLMQFQRDVKERLGDDYHMRQQIRLEVAALEKKFDTLLSSLGLVERVTPAKTEYVKKPD